MAKDDRGYSIGDAFIVLIIALFSSPIGWMALIMTISGIGGIVGMLAQQSDIPNPITIEQLSATTVRGTDAKCYRVVQQGGKLSFVASDCAKE